MMRHTVMCTLCVVISSAICQASSHHIHAEESPSAPLAFTENKGQWDECVKFRANSGGATIWLTTDGIYYHIIRRVPVDNPLANERSYMSHERFGHEPDRIEHLVIKASFVGGNPDVEVVGEGPIEYKCNYFIGNDPSKWYNGVSNYASVTLHGLYDGIDLRFFGSDDGRLTYEYSISTGSDTDQIRLDYERLMDSSLVENGRTIPQTDWGEISGLIAPPLQKPVVSSAGSWRYPSDTTIKASLGNQTRQRNPQGLGLVYSTYIGGSLRDAAKAIALDDSGQVYVTGWTYSLDFPVQNPYQTYQGEWDVFVAKLSSSGTSLIYGTYLGGGHLDEGRSIAVDNGGNVYVTGQTSSSDFPTVNPYQMDQGGRDVFVAKFSNSGDKLIYSTYLGGGSEEEGQGIAVDALSNAYATGMTHSTDFPTENPYQMDQGYHDVFVTKLSKPGNSLIYSTYLGGESVEYGRAIAVDGTGNAYVTGRTSSSDFPTENPYQTDQGFHDVFVTKLSKPGNSLIYSTYLGGESGEYGCAIAVDGTGNAYVTGYTSSLDFPTQNPFQTHGFHDAFVTKFSSSGDSLVYSTFLGGSDLDRGFGIDVDGSGNAYVTGYTYSSDFPTQYPFLTDQGTHDAFVAKLSATGSSLIYGTYLGGGERDYGYGIAVDSSGNAYVTGHTWSSDFPTHNPYQTDQGDIDVFVTKLPSFPICGDADADGEVDAEDAIYLVNYIFLAGPEPVPYESGDADCSGGVDIDDVVWLINYFFTGGNAPCDTDGNEVPDC